MILDRNALSAWSEGLVAVEAFFRAANRLAVPNVVPVFVNALSGPLLKVASPVLAVERVAVDAKSKTKSVLQS